ncbi:hypothetical protein, partial [Halomonas sp. ND22Bw]|uniref:hypothetical protein n=1 Tax=Halomonas sp. ND22Bw TaxID=2054178 RepID=UPI001C6267DD
DSVRPYRAPTPEERDCFCTYHISNTHKIDDCIGLYNEIKRLIQEEVLEEPPVKPSTKDNPLPKFEG